MERAPVEPERVSVKVEYAGFWRRFVAWLIDAVLVNVVAIPILVGAATFADRVAPVGTAGRQGNTNSIVGMLLLAAALVLVLVWLYFARMESSSKQGTLGKRALGIIVTDLDGGQVSFARATARHFGKLLSGVLLYVGFLMAAFSAKKQALHDIMANCLVVKRQ